MAREKFSKFMNMDEPSNKQGLRSRISTLTGWWSIELTPRRNIRSNQQNRWYWSQIAAPLAEYLSDQDYNVTTADEAHELLKARFLATTVICKATGESLGRRVRSTTELSTAEFSEYCERCRAWMADAFNIQVDDPDPAWTAAPAHCGNAA